MFDTSDFFNPILDKRDEIKIDKIKKVSDGMKVSKINKSVCNIIVKHIQLCYQRHPQLLSCIDDEKNNTLVHILIMK